MSPLQRFCFRLTCLVLCGLMSASAAQAATVYGAPRAADVRSRVLAWVAARQVKNPQLIEQVGKLWALEEEAAPDPRQLLVRAIETFALVDPPTKTFVEACNLVQPSILPPDAALLEQDGLDPFYVDNMRLFYASSLAQRNLFDEALEVFQQIDPAHVIDPASCLFFRAVCEHQLLMKSDGLETLKKLLKSTEGVPASYTTIATLMEAELQALEEKSLDEVARMMRDVERRLDLGRGGQKVQKREDEIIATLDEIIEKLESQGGGGGGGAGAGQSNSNQSSSAANDSSVKGATAPGNTDRKDTSGRGTWGNLDPKAEARAKSNLNSRFPAHYGRAAEAYLKKLAERADKSGR